MEKNAGAITIATVLAGFHSTKPKKENISKLYSFVKETKSNESKNR